MSPPKKRRLRVRKSYTWSDVADLMDKVATRCEDEARAHRKLAAMHRSLAHDLRALIRGTLVKV